VDLEKLRKDLERVYPGGKYTMDAQQAKELLALAEAKVDPWRMFRQQVGTQEQIAHIHERLTALEEASNPSPPRALDDGEAEALTDLKCAIAQELNVPEWTELQPRDIAEVAVLAGFRRRMQELRLLRSLYRVSEPNTSAMCHAIGQLLSAGFPPPKG
jgi:hypothetical protein